MALIVVLGAVAMIALLVVAFLTMARTEQRSASAFSDSVDAQNLSEVPLNLAIAQIRRATEQNGVSKTWSSQPGMLRVYGIEPDSTTGGYRAKTVALHKLYSDDKMVITNSGASATTGGQTTTEVKNALDLDASDLASWNAVPGMYVDINEPSAVVTAATNKVAVEFPICDPRAIFAKSGGKAVDGFDFSGHTAPGNALPGTVVPKDATDVSAKLPMPVKWLYMLADGRLVTPTGGSEDGLEFDTKDQPTAVNPITGRVAFWTDDDSCKINVNTATEGTAWDAPKTYSGTDIQFAQRQPAQNEFSRYPGHPAQTCLSPVFQMFGSDWNLDSSTPESQRAAIAERYMNISPRIPWGGSKAGTEVPTTAVPLVDQNGKPKNGRLYANLDEIVFTRDRQAQTPPLFQQDIARGRFFLTTHSRAPELSLFNKSRILLWPLSASDSQRNAKDKLLAFLGTAGNSPYYFQRKSNFSSTDPGSSQLPDQDLSVEVGDAAATNGAPARNRDIYQGLLQPATGPDYQIPGFGSSFAAKWGLQRRNQILTEMFDFVRWSVNSYSTGLTPQYYYLPQRTGNFTGESSAVPVIASNNTRGFGRWPTITEATIVFIATAAKKPTTDMTTTEMQAYVILEPFSPTCGPPVWSANLRYRITGLDSFAYNGTSMGFPAKAVSRVNAANGYLDGGHTTAFCGIAAQFKKANLSSDESKNGTKGGRTLGVANTDTEFPFYSSKINVTGNTQFSFSGGSITIELLTGLKTIAESKTVQTIKLNFPPATLKVPRYTLSSHDKSYQILTTRFTAAGGDLANVLIRDGDITRSVEIAPDNPAAGDLRLLSAMGTIPASWYTVHPKYADTSVERLHFLRSGNYTSAGQYGPGGSDDTIGKYGIGRADTARTAGPLVKGIEYCCQAAPAVPRGLNGAFNADGRPGDWDNGTGKVEDGPYINKADEGNLATADGGYFTKSLFTIESGASFSPNRQISSAVAFGSLPTGITSADQAMSGTPFRPWQTLLFCPNPASRTTNASLQPSIMDHEGFGAPRDHLLLDLFWMPVVEPYAMSESFSTAGKINMNYQMLPFSHIERSTGIYAALKPVSMLAISPQSVKAVGSKDSGHTDTHNYKGESPHEKELRYLVDAKKTLKGFQNRFATGDAFRSASEICEIFLVPQRLQTPGGKSYNTDAAEPPDSYDGMTEWWNGSLTAADAFDLTGDNSREAPYGQLYPRLTTKSNTFTVHYRVQMLRKARSTDKAKWVEGKDAVLSEYRGSAILERYMDPNDKELALIKQGYNDFESTFDNHYRIRVIERKRFSP